MFERYSYIPKLALSPAEMGAYSELPEKDKSSILPVIALRGWVGSKELNNSYEKLKSVANGRLVILDVDHDYVYENKDYLITGEFPRKVFYELADLLSPNRGYKNWCDLVRVEDWIIPVLQIHDEANIALQYKVLSSFGRGVVIRFGLEELQSGKYLRVMDLIKDDLALSENLFLFDLGRIGPNVVDYSGIVFRFVSLVSNYSTDSFYSVTGSSFPESFGARMHGSESIYERLLYSKLLKELPLKFIYSDYGSARYKEGSSGGGVPVPRIDYPLNNDWYFKREPLGDLSGLDKDAKKKKYLEVYAKIAKFIMDQEYWVDNLNVWGDRMIKSTAIGDEYSINSPVKATAVRINLHLYNQLHYGDDIAGLDTDDEWID